MIQIFNTLSREKEPFKPLKQEIVKIYSCGPTPYNFAHIGNMRAYLFEDLVIRTIEYAGYKTQTVMNITDIDDKIIKRAQENNETAPELTARFIAAMNQDFNNLGLLSPDREPKATEYMAQMIDLTKTLLAKGFAYQASNGDVFYKVRAFKTYGSLSKRNIEDLAAGARVEINEIKNDPLDFVLWKMAKEGEPAWDSPWGKGRPGWHIECSAMSEDILGKNFDIHGGGQDLQFPHHENEIAQSEAHNNCQFANYWMHNGFLNINDEKMSKSLGNFFTLRDVLNEYNPEVIRFFMLRSHYRSPLNFSHDNLVDTKNSLVKIYQSLRSYNFVNNLMNKSIILSSSVLFLGWWKWQSVIPLFISYLIIAYLIVKELRLIMLIILIIMSYRIVLQI